MVENSTALIVYVCHWHINRMWHLKLLVLILPFVASSVRTDQAWNYTQIGPRPNESDRFLYRDSTQAVSDANHLCMFCSDEALSNGHYSYQQEHQCMARYYKDYQYQESMVSQKEKDEGKYAFCNIGEVPECGPPANTSHNWTCSYGYTTSSLYSVYSHCHRLCEWSLNVSEALYCNASLMWEVVFESTNPCQAPPLVTTGPNVLPGNEDSGQTLILILISVLVVIVLIVAVGILVFVCRRGRRKKKEEDIEMQPGQPLVPGPGNDGLERRPEERPLVPQNVKGQVVDKSVEVGEDDTVQKHIPLDIGHNNILPEERRLLEPNNRRKEIMAPKVEVDEDETLRKVVPEENGHAVHKPPEKEVDGDETLRKVAPEENGHAVHKPPEEEVDEDETFRKVAPEENGRDIHVSPKESWLVSGPENVGAVEGDAREALTKFKHVEVMPPKNTRFCEPNEDSDEHHDGNEFGAIGRVTGHQGTVSVDELVILQNNLNANRLETDLTNKAPDDFLNYGQGPEAIESTDREALEEGQDLEDVSCSLNSPTKSSSHLNDAVCRPKIYKSGGLSVQNQNGKVKVPLLEYMVLETNGTKHGTSVSERQFAVWVYKGASVHIKALPTGPSGRVLMFRIIRKDPSSECRWEEMNDRQTLVVSNVTEDDIGLYSWRIEYENRTCLKGELDLRLKDDTHQSNRPSVTGQSFDPAIRSNRLANRPQIQQPIQTNQQPNQHNQQPYGASNQQVNSAGTSHQLQYQNTQPVNNIAPPSIKDLTRANPEKSSPNRYMPLDPTSILSGGSTGQGANNRLQRRVCCLGESIQNSDVPLLCIDSLNSQHGCYSDSCSCKEASSWSDNVNSPHLRRQFHSGDIPPPFEERGEPAGSENLDTHSEGASSDCENENEHQTSPKEVYQITGELC